MNEANRRQRTLLGVASGAVLSALLVIPLAIVFDNDLGDRGDETAATVAPPDAPTAPPPSFDPVLAAQGEELYASCQACHGPDARGVTGLGKTLVGSPFVDSKTDAELVAFIKVGRGTDDPENTTGVGMPAKGGNPALTDDDLLAIVNYIRSLN